MIDSKKCPFCKQDNACQAHKNPKNCWCMKLKIPKELSELVVDEYKMKACICQSCREFFIKDKQGFLKQYT